LDAPSAIAVNDVVDDQRRRRVSSEIKDNPVAVGVIGGTVEFPGDDVVGDYVVEAAVVIEPLIVVVRNGAGPTVEIAVVVDEVVVAGEVIAVDGADTRAAGVVDAVADEA